MDQWKYVKYARRGLKHMQDGLRIQSAAEIQENDHAVAAVLCAGDDSLNYSEVASAEVSSGICRVLLQISDELNGFDFEDEEQVYQLRKALVQEARRIIRAKAKAVGIDRNQMDCTLSFVLVSKTDCLALSGNLGSSAVCMIRENEPVLISAPDPTGKLRVCSENAPAELQLRFFNLEDSTLTGFMLTTDGLKNEIYEDGSVLLKKDAEKYINALLADDPEAKLDSYIQKLTQSPDSSYQDDFCFAILSRSNMPVSFDSQTEWLCRCGTRNNISYQFCKSCGTEFASLYKGIDFSRYGGKDMLFRRLNSMPEQEKAFLDQCVKDRLTMWKLHSPLRKNSLRRLNSKPKRQEM
ncbi:MAG: protein phosphatase 2C domain-containing protein [Solobacterium sp.]|nr:protein phosphatase 2C domain-containing protein [Solobacterium sp.]